MATAVEATVEAVAERARSQQAVPDGDEAQGLRPPPQGRACRRRCGWPASCGRCSCPPLTSADMERLMFPLLTPRQQKILEEDGRRRLRPHRLRRRRRDPVPRQPLPAARPAEPGRPPRQHLDPQLRGPGPAAGHGEIAQLRPGDRHPGRRHRLGQDHDHRLDARVHQRARAAAHRHHRGPDRVHLQGRQVASSTSARSASTSSTGTRR